MEAGKAGGRFLSSSLKLTLVVNSNRMKKFKCNKMNDGNDNTTRGNNTKTFCGYVPTDNPGQPEN